MSLYILALPNIIFATSVVLHIMGIYSKEGAVKRGLDTVRRIWGGVGGGVIGRYFANLGWRTIKAVHAKQKQIAIVCKKCYKTI